MPMTTMDDLLARGLRRLLAAHGQGAAQASINHEAAFAPALKQALRSGVAENLKQAERLELVFDEIGLPVASEPDQAMQGIVDDNNAVIALMPRSPALDQDLIRSAQVAAHYYLANYGTLRGYAEALGHGHAARLLQQTLDETGQVNDKFSRLAAQLRRSRPGRAKILAAVGLIAGGAFLVRSKVSARESGVANANLQSPNKPARHEP